MLFVDIVLGPLLTLLIFNPVKSNKATVFDFTVIGAIQISAFIWGLSAVYSQRPVVINFWEGIFYPMITEDLIAYDLKPKQFKKLTNNRPAIVYAQKLEANLEADEERTDLFYSAHISFPHWKNILMNYLKHL